MPICQNCGKEFPNKITVDGHPKRLSGRKFCPECSPLGGRNRRSYIIDVPAGHAHCARCGKDKPLSEFHKRPSTGRPLSYCMACQDAVKILKFEEKLEKAIAWKGGACVDCGGVFPAPVFQFWAEDGPFQISRAKNMSWDRLRRHLEDRDLLCLNCGAIRKWERGD
jgi:hypothetical protein